MYIQIFTDEDSAESAAISVMGKKDKLSGRDITISATEFLSKNLPPEHKAAFANIMSFLRSPENKWTCEVCLLDNINSQKIKMRAKRYWDDDTTDDLQMEFNDSATNNLYNYIINR